MNISRRQRSLTGALAALAALSFSVSSALAADWPQFKRDAARSGDAADEVLKFPLAPVVQVRLAAPIYASPAVVEGRAYIQDAVGNVVCVDCRANRVVWTTPIGGFNNTSSPAVADGKVYVGSTAGHLAILDAKTGKLLKQIPAAGGVITAPAIANDGVYFSTFNGKLTKIKFDGTVQWTFDGGRISIVDFCIRGSRIVFAAGTSNTIFHHLEDAGSEVKLLGKITAPGKCSPMSGLAWVGDDKFAFQSFDSETGWFCLMSVSEKINTRGFIVDVNDARATPAVRGNQIYRGDRRIELETGEVKPAWRILKPVWRTDPQELYDGGFHSSPALTKNLVVLGSERGIVHFFPTEGKGNAHKPVWQFKVPTAGEPNSAVSSSPAIVDGAVYFGGEDGVFYGLGQGKEAELVAAPIAAPEKKSAAPKLTGAEWHSPGGDMGFSCVSADTRVKPPFDIGWKTRVWSSYKSPMIVAEGKVFCSGRGGPLTALDAATGKILWKTHHAGVESRPGPTYYDGKLLLMRIGSAQRGSPYVSGASGGPPAEGLYCHDAKTGKLLWHQPMKLKYQFNHDGLVMHDGKVFALQSQGPAKAADFVAYSVDTGKELWRTPAEKLEKGERSRSRRFASAIAGGLWCVSILGQKTFALDPTTGKIVWETSDYVITDRSRIAARGGLLFVFNSAGDHALDPKTGKLLWKGATKATGYTQALSDIYLESKGTQGIWPAATCAWPIFVNGYWFHHHSFAGTHGDNRLAGTHAPTTEGFTYLTPKHVVWSFAFLSNSCPSPTPAYGRLFYTPNAEGVIYCFVNATGKASE